MARWPARPVAATYSNFDDNDGTGTQVEIAAPGGSFGDGELGILSTLNAGTTVPAAHNYIEYQGTSMAAPHVTGIVSLLLSLKPSLTPAQVLSLVQTTARAFPSGTVRDCTSNLANVDLPPNFPKYCGAGIINADALLTNIMNTGAVPPGPMTATTATLVTSANPNTGASVTFTSNVTGNAPTGNVAFMDNETPIGGCAAVALAGAGNTRTAQCTTSALPAGTHPIRAVYSGDGPNTPADSPTVTQIIRGTVLASTQSPSTQGASVTFTATVFGLNPTGTVQFLSNGVIIAGCNAVMLAGAGNTRTAACSTTSLPPGQHTITALYSGDGSNGSSSVNFVQAVITTTACTGFNDVASSSTFCANVEWLVNRAITLGCGPIAFCAGNSVARLAMAAFMNREGVALTSIVLPSAVFDGGMFLPTPTIACITTDYAVTGFPRKALLRAYGNVYSPDAPLDALLELVHSTNLGVTWTPVPNAAGNATVYSGLSPPDDKTVNLFGALDLSVGSTYRFAIRVTQVAGTGNAGLYCNNRVQIRNRNGTSQPF